MASALRLPRLSDRAAGTHYVPGMTDEQARRAERLELPVLAAVLLTVPVLVLHSLELDGVAGAAVDVANWVLWTVFLLEVVVMLVIAPDDRAWLRRNKLDVAIVVLTPPFLPDALQILWVLRLLRILDVMPVVGRVFEINGFRYAATLAFMAAVGGGLAYAELEDGAEGVANGFDGIYWAITTITTVGYGDITPETVAGKLLAEALMLTGPVLIGIVSASVGQLAERRLQAEAAAVRGDLGELEEAERREDAAERLHDAAIAAQLAALTEQVRILQTRLDRTDPPPLETR
jgi:voltage-gated potassium channel